ncbi:hypothetical protein PPL_05043 [Heterostelium album PN500]|uniref:Protein translocase subunit SecA n=1 Tax=Heterostelium pallidum (strain ATCC 26659 / Pp 5 / PN500) TaxID=670386 RepID=D3B999_HETP5|nr:hypothetical protein PPL_05043 [Heterostelium album PN500]EFA82138.1 hypothetical protein PPL_05043 [Heterostelium album PN500]|eukprot:XP_020434255.1 hypothetical protein PPL_05043 [Heterostelium album PN500]
MLDSFSPIELAAHQNNLNNLNTLIDECGIIDEPTEFKFGDHGTPLDIGILNNSKILIDSFIKSPDDSNVRWTKVVASDNPKNLVLLENQTELYGIVPNLKFNALHIAAYYNCHNITEYLYQIGINVNEVCGIDSMTPIQLASNYNKPLFIKSLVNAIRSISVDNEYVDSLLRPSGVSGGRNALQISMFKDNFISSYILMQASSDVSEGQPSIQLLKFFKANPHSIAWSRIENTLQYLIIFGDNSLFQLSSEELNMYQATQFNSFYNLASSIKWSDRLSYQSKFNRALHFGFTESQSKDILNSDWLAPFTTIPPKPINDSECSDILQRQSIQVTSHHYEFLKSILSEKSLSRLNEFRNNEQLERYFICLQTMYEHPQRTNLIQLFDKVFGRQWPLDMLFKTTTFTEVVIEIISTNNTALWNWFINHFTLRLISSIDEKSINLAIFRMKKFINLLLHTKNKIRSLDHLSYPPTDLQLSFQSDTGIANMELAIKSLSIQDNLRFIQASLLHNLPKNREYIEYCIGQAQIDSLLVCRQVFEVSHLSAYSKNNIEKQTLQLPSTCGLAINSTFKGLLGCVLVPVHATFMNNFITNIRIIQMFDNISVPVGCKLALIQYFITVLAHHKFNIISRSDILDSSRVEWAREMQKIISLVPQLLKSIGVTYFSKLVKLVENNHTSFNLMSEKSSSLRPFIDLTDNILSSWAENIPKSKILNANTYESLRSIFREEQDKIIKAKINQKSFVEVIKNFKAPLNMNPLPNQHLALLEKIYTEVEKNQEKHRNLSQQQLINICIESSNQLKFDNSKQLFNLKNVKSSVEILSALRWLIYLSFGIYPYSTQMCTVIGLLLCRDGNSDLGGRIAQVLTGEGKSTIVTLLTSYCGLLGKQIDVITTSEYLAYRDFIKYESFYQLIGISCSQITGQLPPESAFNAQILFGTNTNYEFALLRDELYGSKNLFTDGKPRLKEIVIVDEVDSLFIDSAFNSARMAIPSQEHHGFIYQPISNYVKQHLISWVVVDENENDEEKEKQISQSVKDSHIKEGREILKKSVQELPYDEKTKSHTLEWVQSMSDQRIKLILSCAIQSFFLKEGIDYVITQTNEHGQNLGNSTVVIVDKDNTGRLMIGSRYSDGLHEFIEVKHNLLPERDSLTAAAISHPSFFSMYDTIFGLTGTCGEEQEREELKSIYNVDTFDVPSYLPSKRVKLQSLKFDDNEEYQKRVIQEIKENLSLSRPVLLLLSTINDSQTFTELLKNEEGVHRIQTLNEMQMENEEVIITRAGEPRTLTIATNTAGRGTDIKLTRESLSAGGIHVIFGFYPSNIRVENQGLGRAGRQGQPGSCRIIISKEDIAKSSLGNMLKSFEDFDHFRSLKCILVSGSRLQRSKIDQLQYKLLEKFFSLMKLIRTSCTVENLSTLIQSVKSKSTSKCNCNNQEQLRRFTESLAYQNLIEGTYKLDINNHSSVETFAIRLSTAIKEFYLQDWSEIFTSHFNISNHDETVYQFDLWWLLSGASCIEENIDDHIVSILLTLQQK